MRKLTVLKAFEYLSILLVSGILTKEYVNNMVFPSYLPIDIMKL